MTPFFGNLPLHMVVDVFQIDKRHNTLCNATLVGCQHQAQKTLIKIGYIFSCIWIKNKLTPVSDIVPRVFKIDHTIPVKKKCPAVINLRKIKLQM